jgi:hypothetical protein
MKIMSFATPCRLVWDRTQDKRGWAPARPRGHAPDVVARPLYPSQAGLPPMLRARDTRWPAASRCQKRAAALAAVDPERKAAHARCAVSVPSDGPDAHTTNDRRSCMRRMTGDRLRAETAITEVVDRATTRSPPEHYRVAPSGHIIVASWQTDVCQRRCHRTQCGARSSAPPGLRASNITLRARRSVEDSTPVRQDAATQPWGFC